MARVAALVKVVATRVEVDALSGVPSPDTRFLGISAADRAAVAVAMQLGAQLDEPVDVFCVAPPAASAVLLELAASVTGRTVRVALRGDEHLSIGQWLAAYPSDLVARSLSLVVGRPSYVVAGDHSLDRGSGSVPARLAERLGYASGLGLIELNLAEQRAMRRLPGGWREELAIRPESVLSVEASVATLGRAGLMGLRAAEIDEIVLRESVATGASLFAPYRPTPRVVDPPKEVLASRRAMEVIGLSSQPRRREVIEVDPDTAADEILARLAAWGYR